MVYPAGMSKQDRKRAKRQAQKMRQQQAAGEQEAEEAAAPTQPTSEASKVGQQADARGPLPSISVDEDAVVKERQTGSDSLGHGHASPAMSLKPATVAHGGSNSALPGQTPGQAQLAESSRALMKLQVALAI